MLKTWSNTSCCEHVGGIEYMSNKVFTFLRIVMQYVCTLVQKEHSRLKWIEKTSPFFTKIIYFFSSDLFFLNHEILL
jgi:hypothetical protein